MITRSSKHILKYSNKNKLQWIDLLFKDYKIALKECIDLILSDKLPLRNFLNSNEIPILNNIKHSQWKQLIYKQASEIIRSTIKKNHELRFKRYKKVYKYFVEKNRMINFTNKKLKELNLKQKFIIKPNAENISINIDERLLDIRNMNNSFDEFILMRLPYFYENKKRAISINLPIKQHKQSLKFKGWDRKKTVQLQKINDNYYVSFIYENIETPLKQEGEVVGIDIGYKKLITASNGEIQGRDNIENIYEKISKAKRNSRNYKQLLKQRTNVINQEINKLNLSNVKTVVIEDLKSVKKNSKLSTKFMNKLQYWIYPDVIKRLEENCKEQGVELVKVSPAYTSQTCSRCKTVDKESRKGEKFICRACSFEIDADINAAINIRNRGVYSPSNIKS